MEADILGQRLGRRRQELGLSLAQVVSGLAEPVSRSFLNQVEQGKCYPSVPVLRALAQRLDISLDELVEGEPHAHSRLLRLEQAWLELAKGRPAQALRLLEALEGDQPWPLAADRWLCGAEALIMLGRQGAALSLVEAAASAAQAHGDAYRLACAAALREGWALKPRAEESEQFARQAMRSGDARSALEHIRAARILARGAPPSTGTPSGRRREVARQREPVSRDRGH
jgi:transcriptional regulator with XRE-family HTH domain